MNKEMYFVWTSTPAGHHLKAFFTTLEEARDYHKAKCNNSGYYSIYSGPWDGYGEIPSMMAMVRVKNY